MCFKKVTHNVEDSLEVVKLGMHEEADVRVPGKKMKV